MENPNGVLVDPLLTRPETVAIVCLGHSMQDYVRECMTTARMKKPYDEIWTLNRGIRGFAHDKLFAMDDLRWLSKRDSAYGEFLKSHDKPVITSTVYPEFPSAVSYPYNQVLDKLGGEDVFNVNTVAYMVAYAILTEVKDLAIFGADFFYPNGNHAESGGQAVAFLLGLGKFYGMRFRLPGSTTLLYANKVQQLPPTANGIQQIGRPPYGYHRRAELTEQERGIPQHVAG